MKDKYKHEYINCEVSVIIDTVDNHELFAEELTDRLNYETRMHEKYKKENAYLREGIVEAFHHERTDLGRSVLRQLAESLGVDL